MLPFLAKHFLLKLEHADLRTSPLHGTPSVQSVHNYYPFALEDGGRLAHMAAELVDRLATLAAVRRFPGMGAADSRSLRSDIYVRMQHFVRRTTFVPFRRFGGGAARIHATSLCFSSWYFEFLSPQRFACGHC
jgi:hypothetical protein